MKKINLLLLLLGLLCCSLYSENNKIDVIFMHDIHSHLDECSKSSILIKNQLSKNPSTFILDGGDFSVGTIYQALFSNDAAELSMLSRIGVDVFTLGDHEFDYGYEGLCSMFNKASSLSTTKKKFPQLAMCNVDWTFDNDYTKSLKASIEKYNNKTQNTNSFFGTSPYVTITKGNHKICVIGVIGKSAISSCSECALNFLDPIESVANTVKYIKENETCDLIVCLSHSGTDSKLLKSEDEMLAIRVPDIDLIISAHSHTIMNKPIVRGNTTIVSCGANNNYLGNISLQKNNKNRWQCVYYNLDDLNKYYYKDDSIEQILSAYRQRLDSYFYDNYECDSSTVLATSNKTVEKEMGYVISDCIYDDIRQRGIKADMIIVPEALIRGSLPKGNITMTDIFTSYSLGSGEDGYPGYPFVNVFITGKDIKKICEMDASLSSIMPDSTLYFAGIKYKYNRFRMPFDKVYEVTLNNNQSIEEEKLYSVVMDLYSAKVLSSVQDKTHGLIKISLNDINGNKITKLKYNILKDMNGRDLKGFYMVAKELANRKVLKDYSELQNNTKIDESTLNPILYFKNISGFAFKVYRVLIVGILVILGIIYSKTHSHYY